MDLARKVYFWSGVYGILLLFPLFLLEERIGRDFPPATNHPEQYYAFLGVALAWQFVFLVIARDPLRYRPLMVPATLEKFLPAGAIVWLFSADRVSGSTLAPFVVDLGLGILFLLSYVRTAGPRPQPMKEPADTPPVDRDAGPGRA